MKAIFIGFGLAELTTGTILAKSCYEISSSESKQPKKKLQITPNYYTRG